ATDEISGDAVAVRIVDAAFAANPEVTEAYRVGFEHAQHFKGEGVAAAVAFQQKPLASASELVEGPSLGDYIAEYGALPFDIAIELFHSLVGILLPYHEQGLNHGALSPAAVLLVQRGIRLIPRLKGFGLAP